MNIQEIDSVTKSVFASASIKSSSDFIIVAHKIHEQFYPKIAYRITPLIQIETGNYHDNWITNTVHSENNLYKLSMSDLYDAQIAYRIVMDYFLSDDIISKKFNLDENDSLGWQIYKELDTKYNYCRKRLIKLNYIRNQQENICIN